MHKHISCLFLEQFLSVYNKQKKFYYCITCVDEFKIIFLSLIVTYFSTCVVFMIYVCSSHCLVINVFICGVKLLICDLRSSVIK